MEKDKKEPKKKVLEVKNLNKKIKKKQILRDVSLYIEEGDIMGFVGPNGAGKTTTIKIILGLQKATSGKIYINGFDIKKDFKKAIEKVGAIVENPDSYMYLTGRQNLELIRRLYDNIPKERIDDIIKLVKLEERIDDKVSKYSLGMRQRLGIAKALVHDPNLLILDEPTNGLDPEGIKELRELLKELALNEHMTIFISSHNLAEIETLCNKISIIQNGKILENNTIENIKKSNDKFKYIIEVEKPEDVEKTYDILVKIIQDKNNVKKIEDTSKVEIELSKEQNNINEYLKELIKNDIGIVQIYKENISLEDAFIKKVGGNKIV